MINPCTKEKAALHRYSPSVHNRIFPILSKSIPPVPLTFATRPLNSSVVAFTKNLWSHNIKYRTDNGENHHANQTNLILTHITQQFFTAPEKSFAFSPFILPRPIGPREGRLLFSLIIQFLL